MPDDDTKTTVQGMTVTCPPGWRDSSMLIVTAEQPGRSGVTPNFVITREPLPDDLAGDRVQRLQAFLQRQRDRMQVSLTRFREVSRRDPTVDHLTAELRFTWVSDDIPIMQSIVYAFADETTLISSTSTAGEDDFAGLQQIFRQMLRSFRTS